MWNCINSRRERERKKNACTQNTQQALLRNILAMFKNPLSDYKFLQSYDFWIKRNPFHRSCVWFVCHVVSKNLQSVCFLLDRVVRWCECSAYIAQCAHAFVTTMPMIMNLCFDRRRRKKIAIHVVAPARGASMKKKHTHSPTHWELMKINGFTAIIKHTSYSLWQVQ